MTWFKRKKKLTWHDITLRQALAIKEATNIEDEYEQMFTIGQIIFGDSINKLSFKDFIKKYNDELEFIKTDIPHDLNVDKVKVNGREYYFDGLLGNISTAQYVDFQQYLKTNDEKQIYSVFFIPVERKYLLFKKKHKYNDGYDMLQVFKDIEDIPIDVLFSASFFFSRQFVLFIKIFRRYSIKSMKKTGLPKEVMENLEKVVNLSTDLMISPLESFRS